MRIGKFELEHDRAGPLRIFQWPEPGALYALGADSCGGMGSGDYAAACVVRCDTEDLVATFRAHTEPAEFAYALKDLGEYFCGKQAQAYAVVESNGPGHATILRMRDIGYANLYCNVTWDKIYQKEMTTFGFRTNPQTRALFLSCAQEAMRDPSVKIPDLNLLREMQNFIFTDKGKPQASVGEHDDLVMAFGMAQLGKRFQVEKTESTPSAQRLSWEDVRAGILSKGKDKLKKQRMVVQTGWI